MNRKKCTTLIVTPYFEDLAVEQFCQVLAANLGADDAVLVVDDGSIEKPFKQEILRKHRLNGLIVRLKRNQGHQAAIACGLHTALDQFEFERVVIMDSDGEDMPGNIAKIVSALDEFQNPSGNFHSMPSAVVATRKSRVESIWFKAFYWCYKAVFSALVGKNIRFGNFMALNPQATEQLASLPETPMHVAGSLMNSRIKIQALPLDRGARYSGKSAMNLTSLTLHGLRSVMVFADTVFVRISLFCAAAVAFIVLALLIMVIIKLAGLAIPGWFSTIGGILLMLLVQIGAISLLVLLSASNSRSKTAEGSDCNAIVGNFEKVERTIDV